MRRRLRPRQPPQERCADGRWRLSLIHVTKEGVEVLLSSDDASPVPNADQRVVVVIKEPVQIGAVVALYRLRQFSKAAARSSPSTTIVAARSRSSSLTLTSSTEPAPARRHRRRVIQIDLAAGVTPSLPG